MENCSFCLLQLDKAFLFLPAINIKDLVLWINLDFESHWLLLHRGSLYLWLLLSHRLLGKTLPVSPIKRVEMFHSFLQMLLQVLLADPALGLTAEFLRPGAKNPALYAMEWERMMCPNSWPVASLRLHRRLQMRFLEHCPISSPLSLQPSSVKGMPGHALLASPFPLMTAGKFSFHTSGEEFAPSPAVLVQVHLQTL